MNNNNNNNDSNDIITNNNDRTEVAAAAEDLRSAQVSNAQRFIFTFDFTEFIIIFPIEQFEATVSQSAVHPVSITRFPLRRFSPGAGLLRNRFFHR